MTTVKKMAVISDHSSATTKKHTSHANDPFVLKKLAQAKAIMSKVKLPDYLKK